MRISGPWPVGLALRWGRPSEGSPVILLTAALAVTSVPYFAVSSSLSNVVVFSEWGKQKSSI